MASELTVDIEKKLARIHLLKRRVLYIFLGYLPCVLIVGFIGQSFALTEGDLILVACLYGLFLVFAAIPLCFVTCPNCSNKYFRYKSSHNPFAKKCMNCGICRV